MNSSGDEREVASARQSWVDEGVPEKVADRHANNLRTALQSTRELDEAKNVIKAKDLVAKAQDFHDRSWERTRSDLNEREAYYS